MVFILESRVTLAKAGETLDMTPPSESYDRQEMVVLIGQITDGEHMTRMLPIRRLGNGRFWNLDDPQELHADTFEGRFAKMLPSKPVDETTRQMGKVLMEAMGVKVQKLVR